jgi:hypothetical protein
LGEEGGKGTGVKWDEHAKRLTAYSARRVVQFAVMQKIARQEFGDLYKNEFIQVYHDAQPGASWFWDDLDKEDEEFLMSLERVRKGGKEWIKSD